MNGDPFGFIFLAVVAVDDVTEICQRTLTLWFMDDATVEG